jgi:hypothetical protein
MPGAYTVTAKNHLYGLEDVKTTTFVGHAVKLVLEANQTALMVNQTVSLTATMKDANDLTTSSLDGGEVIFNANGVQIAKVVLNNGVASTTYTRNTPATVTIEAFYNVSLQDSVSVTVTTGRVCGDVDTHEGLDARDVAYLAKHVAGISGWETLYGDGDVDTHEGLDARDVAYLAKHVAGISGWETLHC